MSVEDENVSILRQAYQEWHDSKGASPDRWLAAMDDEVDSRSLADGAESVQFTSRRKSRQEVVDYFSGLAEGWEMIHYTVDEYVAQGDRVVALGSTSWRNRQTGAVFDTPKVDVWRFRDGRAVEFFELYDTAMVLAAAGT